MNENRPGELKSLLDNYLNRKYDRKNNISELIKMHDSSSMIDDEELLKVLCNSIDQLTSKIKELEEIDKMNCGRIELVVNHAITEISNLRSELEEKGLI